MRRYVESRANWRKSWRQETAQRRAKLSLHARGTLKLLIDHAADDGCLGEVARKGRPESEIAASMGIRSQDRKGFARDFAELLEYGDDGGPCALVERDGAFYLTRFVETQARRTTHGQPADNPRATYGQPTDNIRTTVEPKAPESLDSENAEATEERRNKKEERIKRETRARETQDRAPPKAVNGDEFTWQKVAGMFADRYRAERNLEWTYSPHVQALIEITEAIRCQRGDPLELAERALGSYFRDPWARKYDFPPKALAKQIGRHLAPPSVPDELEWEDREAMRRVEAERRHSAELARKFERDAAQAALPPPLEDLLEGIGNYPRKANQA